MHSDKPSWLDESEGQLGVGTPVFDVLMGLNATEEASLLLTMTPLKGQADGGSADSFGSAGSTPLATPLGSVEDRDFCREDLDDVAVDLDEQDDAVLMLGF